MRVNKDDMKVLEDSFWAQGNNLHQIRVAIAENNGKWSDDQTHELFENVNQIVDDLKLFSFLFKELFQEVERLSSDKK